jgi:hypothetical protein
MVKGTKKAMKYRFSLNFVGKKDERTRLIVEVRADARNEAVDIIEAMLDGDYKRVKMFFLDEKKEEPLTRPTTIQTSNSKPIRKLNGNNKYWLNREEVIRLIEETDKLSRKDLCALVDTSYSNFCIWMSNKRRIKSKHINTLAEYFEVDPATLVNKTQKLVHRITGNMENLKSLDEWGKSLYKSILLPEEAEERYRQLTIKRLVSLWKK